MVTEQDGVVVGYYTLVAAQVQRDSATPSVRKGMSKRSPIPVVLLARLAIAQDAQCAGLGAALLADAMRRSVRAPNRRDTPAAGHA